MTEMSRLYLSSVKNESGVEGQSDIFSFVETKLIMLLRDHPDQKRIDIYANFTLMKVAKDYARRMADERFEGHQDPNGFGPNHRVREAGYPLPDYYGKEPGSNNIESLQWGGDGDPEHAWAAWLTSERHKIHLLGLNAFYASQNCIGMGYWYDPNSIHKHYYCFLSAPCL
jgi:cysteine-rich secretory family protein